MAWPLRQRTPEAHPETGAPWFPGEYVPGDCWYYFGDLDALSLSPEYRANGEGKRPPIVVVFPARDGHGFPLCIDERASDSEHGWEVSGDLPSITVTPSINAVGEYHGWITNGVITDGVE